MSTRRTLVLGAFLLLLSLANGVTSQAGQHTPSSQSFWLFPSGGVSRPSEEALSAFLAAHAPQLSDWQYHGFLADFRPVPEIGAILLEEPEAAQLAVASGWGRLIRVEQKQPLQTTAVAPLWPAAGPRPPAPELAEPVARAALSPAVTFIVSATNDSADANPGDGNCDDGSGHCTLRAAIQESNALPGADQITVAAGTYLLSLAGSAEDDAATGDLDINGDLILSGDPLTSTIIEGDSGLTDRVFHVHGGQVAFQNLTVRNGGPSPMYNDYYGGGVLLESGGTLTVTASTISGNHAINGGGILSFGTLTVVNSTISGNGSEGGGGIDVRGGTTTLSSVTISNNTGGGGGFGNGGGVRGDFTARNTIIANNIGDDPDCAGTLTSGGYNLIENTTGCTIEGDLTGNITFIDPMLEPLQFDGGPTQTHPLNRDSVAVDAGNPLPPGSGGNACPAVDQRGSMRPVDGDQVDGARCDMGAYELNPTVRVTQFRSYLGETYVEGRVDEDNVPITLTLRSGAMVKSEVSTVSSPTYFDAFFDTAIAGGDLIDVAVAGQTPITIEAADLSVEANKSGDTLIGSAPAGASLTALLYSYLEWDWYYEYPVADAGGTFTADFGDQIDIFTGDEYELRYDDPDALPYSYRTILRDQRVTGFGVDTELDRVRGYAVPGVPVALTLKDSGGATIATASLQASNDGSFYGNFYASGLVDITSGQQVQMQYGSEPVQSLDVVEATITTLDTVANNVSGNAPASSKLRLNVSDQYLGASARQLAHADGNGHFSANVSLDLVPGSYVAITYLDAADNEVAPSGRFAGPYVRAYLNSHSDLFAIGQPGEIVTGTLRNSLGVIKGGASGETATTGAVSLRFLDSIGNDVDPIAGDTIEITYEGGDSRTLDIVDIDYIADRQARMVSGQGPANSVIRLNYDWDEAVAEVNTDDQGNFTHTFSTRLTGGYTLNAYYRNAQGDDIQVYGNVPQFTVSLLGNSLYGYAAANRTVVVTVEDATRTRKGGATTTSSTGGWYSVYFNDLDIVAGDWVIVDAGPLHFEQQMVSLSIAADPANELVYGTAPVNAWLNVFDEGYLGPYARYNYRYFSADTAGNFATTFPEVRSGDYLSVLYWEGGYKDRVQLFGYAAPFLHIRYTHDTIYGYAEVGSSGTITIRAGNGTVKASGTVDANTTTGNFSYTAAGADLVPGDTVEIHVGTLNRTVDVVPMQASLELSGNTITGSSLVSSEIGVEGYHWNDGNYSDYVDAGSLSRFVTTSASGTFTADFDSLVDFQPGDYAGLFYMDANDNAYSGYFYTTTPTVTIANYPNSVQPNQPVDVQLTLTGAHSQNVYIRWDTESHADDNRYAFSSGSQRGVIGTNLLSFVAPAGDDVYFKVFASVDGQAIASAEHSLSVDSSAATTLHDPVSGTTNDATPAISGITAPNAAVTLYEDMVVVANTTADSAGTFTFSLATPLSNGEHELHAVATVGAVEGPSSNIIHLTVDPTLPVDPVHILLTTRNNTQHLRDDNGYANLGGRIWTRTGDPVSVSIPISYTVVYTADLYVGGVFATSLIDSGDDVYVGSYTPLGTGNYSLDLKVRQAGPAGPVSTTNILTGLIDPDGYVYDLALGLDHRVAGANVTCYQLVDSEWQFWNGAIWEQENPQTTQADGYYAFFTLPGTYRVHVSAPGYYEHESPPLTVVDTPVHYNAPLQRATPPVAAFDANVKNGKAPLMVTFDNLSSGDFDSCVWDFGDENSSTDCADPQHTYVQPGTYTVMLTVSGDGGSDMTLQSDYITVIAGGSNVYLPVVVRKE